MMTVGVPAAAQPRKGSVLFSAAIGAVAGTLAPGWTGTVGSPRGLAGSPVRAVNPQEVTPLP
jgi:hypothetical protein